MSAHTAFIVALGLAAWSGASVVLGLMLGPVLARRSRELTPVTPPPPPCPEKDEFFTFLVDMRRGLR